MGKENHLSDNLRAYQHARSMTLTELSLEFGIAKSTIQSIMADGNTTLDTLVRIAGATNSSLDELVFGDLPAKQIYDLQFFLGQLEWFTSLPAEKRRRLMFHLLEILRLLGYDE